MTALNRKLFRDAIHMRGQVIAVTLVVACGIATHVTMRSSYQSLVAAQASYYESCRFSDVFAYAREAPNALEAAIAAIPGVAMTQTRIVKEVTLDIPGLSEPATGRLISIPERRTPMLNDLYLRQGRYVEPRQSDEVLISEAFAGANGLKVGDAIGAVINGRWKRLRIVGVALSPEYVYEIREAEVFPDSRRFGVLWMGRESLGPAFNMEGAFNNVTLSLARGASEPEVIVRLDKLLERYGGLGAYGRGDQISHRFLTDELAENRVGGWFLPSVFLGIVAFLIHILLSRLVTTQRRQIAVLKAFGYSDAAIGAHYLQLALVIVLAGTALGTALGLWFGSRLTQTYAAFFHFPALRFQPDAQVIGLAIAISGMAACLGALLAVRGVVALAPAEAMRPESPARFRPGLVERAGLQKVLSISARMIVRNIERRPGKAAISTLAVAFAVAILVVGRYMIDSVNLLVDLQFHTLQREDVTVIFNEPHTSRARYAVARLPGVQLAEPFRQAPARLRVKHRSRRTAILGLAPRGELRRLIDRQMRAAELPAEGMILTTMLAEILDASPGDMITVEILEGARPVREVALAGLLDEPIGLGAYMDIRALHRLMREGETVSGAYLLVDSASTARLYALLKRTPGVSGVAVREAMLASFWDTFGKNITTMTVVLVVFACVIAFGIVYNGARIALSERGHELASLRVLGFTQGEIAAILLGEQAALAAAAIPLGFALGFGLAALTSMVAHRELFRLPLVVTPDTYTFAFLVVAAAALFSGLAVVRRLYRMDLTAVLKATEA